MQLQERDYVVLSVIDKFYFILSRHVKVFAQFSNQRTTDRRLQKLEAEKYIKREKLLYATPSLITLTSKGKTELGVNKRKSKIKLDTVKHDILVLDIVTLLIEKYNITINDILSEKDIHRNEGFSKRKHAPDFVYSKYAFEIELSLKSKERIEKNIASNFLNYDKQIWMIRKSNKKIEKILLDNITKYPNLHILYLEEF